MTRPLIALGATLALLTTAAQADTLVGDSYVTGRLCVGGDCVPGEGFGVTALKLKQTVNRLAFVDTSIGADFPSNDWQLWVNDDFQFGLDRFSIKDNTGGTMPFTIEAGAPDNALWIADNGKIGLGTMSPLGTLNISQPFFPAFVMTQTSSAGSTVPAAWVKAIQADGTLITYATTNSASMRIASGPNTDQTLGLASNGNSYLADVPNFVPHARLHLSFADGTTQLKLEETNATTSPRTLLNLQNNGRPEIVMGNTDTGGEWSFGAGTKFILKQGSVGSAPSAKTKLFEISDTGDATLTGSLTTGGTTCGGGCDRVFTDRAIIPAEDYAAQMWAQGFLPHVGPTPEGAPLNVSEKLGGMLNALEHAHVYIDRQRGTIAAQETRIAQQDARIDALSTRLHEIETRLSKH